MDGGATRPMTIRVTHVYRRIDGEWQLVHRHADFPPADQRQTTALVHADVLASATVADPLSQDFYRIAQSNPPSERDFMSYEELGIPPRRPLSPVDKDRWRGVSHYATYTAAEAAALAMPRLGRFIVTVRIPADASVRIQQTGRDPDHFTIWATAAALLAWIVSIRPVQRVH